VINVNWSNAQEYVRWLSKETGKDYHLLSEAEWEYAARAGANTAYYWGDDVGIGNANCSQCGSQWDGKETAPAGSFKPNGFDLYDMAGNVWQWVQDCSHDDYTGAPIDGSAWMTGDCNSHIVRGGSWFDPPEATRAASRFGNPSDIRGPALGFRVGETLAP
jgi:formylglycine-generating enzyme required for sulfatase activity